ncbi:MAG: hypothetical protein Q9165_006084 [Trypethelium subeluteriae]
MSGPRLGQTRSGRPLLKTVNGKPHARAEDHEDYPLPYSKRRCREKGEEAPREPSQIGEIQHTANPARRTERFSASPISSDSDDAYSVQAPRKIGEQDAETESKCNAPRNQWSNGRKNGRQSKSGSTGRPLPTDNRYSDDAPAGFHSSSGNKAVPRRKVYSGKNKPMTKNVHVESRLDAEEKKATLKEGFRIPPSVQLLRSECGSGVVPSVSQEDIRLAEDDSSNSSSEGDSELSTDRAYREARGPSGSKNRSKGTPPKKNQCAANGFKTPLNFIANDPRSSLSSTKEFKTPNETSTHGSDSPLSSPPGSSILEFAEDSIDILVTSSQISHDSPYAVCPVCDELVDRSFLDEFANYASRMSVRRQALFCHAHKRRSAVEEYRIAGYPEIDWHTLPRRLQLHHGHINNILDRKEDSWYRKRLEERAKSGKQRTLRQTAIATDDESSLHKFVPGYYGMKGARLMIESIINHFSNKIRRLAASDDLLSLGGGGIAGYVQSVLVPELAVDLIKEDLYIDDEEARKVLSESTKIGRLVPSGLYNLTYDELEGISHALVDIVDLTTITEEPEPEQEPVQAQENSISLTSLETLAHHPSDDIRRASTRILLKRFLSHPSAPTLFVNDLDSLDPSTRLSAQVAAAFIREYGFHVPGSRGISARQSALRDLHHLPPVVTEAESVFGGSSDEEQEEEGTRTHGFIATLPTGLPPTAHESIISMRRRRRRYSSVPLQSRSEDLTNTPSYSRAAGSGANSWTRSQWEEESPEETELRRRRHREAMVLHEGGGSLSEDDIIQGPTARAVSRVGRGHSVSTARGGEGPGDEMVQPENVGRNAGRNAEPIADARAEAEAAGVLGGINEGEWSRDQEGEQISNDSEMVAGVPEPSDVGGED